MTFQSAGRLFGAALVLAPALAAAQTSSKVVTLGGKDYTVTAKSLVSAAGDINANPIYSTPISPAFNGVGSIRITATQADGSSGTFICTGSLLADGKTVLTAAHCLTGGIGTVTAISANFYPTSSSPVTLTAASWNANPLYSGQVIDENDVGVIHLTAEAPSSISRYALYTGTAENQAFDFVGYGRRGSFGAGTGAAGNGAGFGLANRRQGYNLFDITLGDSRWCSAAAPCPPDSNNYWYDPSAATAHVLLTDFDNGTTGFNSQDGMCWLGQFSNFTLGVSECNPGLGQYEAISGGGDSGGPGFIDGMIASVTSFGLSFGSYNGGGDIDASLNSSFGEFAGFTDVAYQSSWITSQMDLTSLDPTVAGPPVVTPEPASIVLMATGLVGVIGFARRRRNGSKN